VNVVALGTAATVNLPLFPAVVALAITTVDPGVIPTVLPTVYVAVGLENAIDAIYATLPFIGVSGGNSADLRWILVTFW
jgi:hypothetical protein